VTNSLRNPFQHSFGVLQHIVVPETQYAYPEAFKLSLSAEVASDLSIITMATSVQFDGKLRLRAEKIHDVWPEGLLPAKLQASKATVAQVAPQFAFCVG